MPITSFKTKNKSRGFLVGNTAYIPAIAVFSGGTEATNTIDYVLIASTGNATDFGDLTSGREGCAGCSSNTRGLTAGGTTVTGSDSWSNVIDYVTIASTGNATDFGDLLATGAYLSGLSNQTRGIFSGGYNNNRTDTIQYVTIASAGNAIDFGNLANDCFGGAATWYAGASCASPTRGIIFPGSTAFLTACTDSIHYITIATTGNATDFGDRTVSFIYVAACSSSTRALCAGGTMDGSRSNTIDYVTIATTGNATDFGDLTVGRSSLAGTSSSTRGLFAGGNAAGNTRTNTIDYVTIASTGNATDFGDLTTSREVLAAFSNAHGGL